MARFFQHNESAYKSLKSDIIIFDDTFKRFNNHFLSWRHSIDLCANGNGSVSMVKTTSTRLHHAPWQIKTSSYKKDPSTTNISHSYFATHHNGRSNKNNFLDFLERSERSEQNNYYNSFNGCSKLHRGKKAPGAFRVFTYKFYNFSIHNFEYSSIVICSMFSQLCRSAPSFKIPWHFGHQ